MAVNLLFWELLPSNLAGMDNVSGCVNYQQYWDALPNQSLSELDNLIRAIQNAIGTHHFNISAVRMASDTFPQSF